MRPLHSRRQRGVALIALLAVLAIGASAFLIRQLNAESGGMDAIRKNRNAEVLNRAKQALIGYVAMQAAQANEKNPGALPCPEHAWYIGLPYKEGTMGPSVGVPSPGFGSSDCASIGRLPWRTLGPDKLLDAAGEPLWYVVSPGWALSNGTTPPLTTYINSNSTGQLLFNARAVSALTQALGLATVVSTAHGFRTGDIVKIAGATPAGYNLAASVTFIDANTFTYAVDPALSTPATGSIKAGDTAVALIIAPSPAMNVAASADCAPRSQARSVPAPAINALDYLECYDATNGLFSTTGPTGSFNDQVVKITAAEILPAIEAVIANRIEREIAPQLKGVYASSAWGLSSSNPLFPYPAQFNNPDPGTSSFQGVSATPGGLLPVTSASCTGDPRCSATFVAWNTTITPTATASGGTVLSSSCSVTATIAQCTGNYEGVAGTNNVVLRLTATATNVAMALKQFDASKVTITPAAAVTPTGAFNNDGSARIFSDAAVSGQGIGTSVAFSISANIGLLADHPVIQSTDATYGWFVRNEWHRLLYYAVARGHTAEKLPPVCPTTIPFVSSCLSVANVTPAGSQRAILILTGRSVNGTARPSSTLGNYLEFGNATAAYERRTVSASNYIAPAQRFNDRIVVIDSN